MTPIMLGRLVLARVRQIIEFFRYSRPTRATILTQARAGTLPGPQTRACVLRTRQES